ncbi:unnamed protein product [Protopolystoma xenopodis]|uniref:Uncharacterized protein n=1 Tax=Protopolystoma xenopodis TaxID=117903 RepID=A0A448XDA1_9PLAT|nr:unnamed protein product [Protopolystoma xenopodis]
MQYTRLVWDAWYHSFSFQSLVVTEPGNICTRSIWSQFRLLMAESVIVLWWHILEVKKLGGNGKGSGHKTAYCRPVGTLKMFIGLEDQERMSEIEGEREREREERLPNIYRQDWPSG